MKPYLLFVGPIAIFSVGLLLGANTAPKLTSEGYVLFSGGSTISAPSGNITLAPNGSAHVQANNKFGVAIDPSTLFHASTNGLVPASVLFGAADAGIFTGNSSIVRVIGVPNPPAVVFQGAGGTIAAPTTSVNGNTLGTMFFLGHDGTTRTTAATIVSLVDAAVGAGIVPGRLSFQTATAGGVLTEALKLDSAQLATFSGNVNTTGVYQKGGVSGTGGNTLFTVCEGVTAGACSPSCTLQFNGGIRVGGTCP